MYVIFYSNSKFNKNLKKIIYFLFIYSAGHVTYIHVRSLLAKNIIISYKKNRVKWKIIEDILTISFYCLLFISCSGNFQKLKRR